MGPRNDPRPVTVPRRGDVLGGHEPVKVPHESLQRCLVEASLLDHESDLAERALQRRVEVSVRARSGGTRRKPWRAPRRRPRSHGPGTRSELGAGTARRGPSRTSCASRRALWRASEAWSARCQWRGGPVGSTLRVDLAEEENRVDRCLDWRPTGVRACLGELAEATTRTHGTPARPRSSLQVREGGMSRVPASKVSPGRRAHLDS